MDHRDVVVLFPSKFAISFPEWIESIQQERMVGSSDTNSNIPSRSPLTVIVVDAVWRHARRMATRLRERLPDIRHVQLTPEQMSVYARKQSQPDRICTVEAAALFLSLYGEEESTTDAMVQCVKINNEAIRPPSNKATAHPELAPLYSKDVPHPAWYFGRYFYRQPDSRNAKKTPKKNRKYL